MRFIIFFALLISNFITLIVAFTFGYGYARYVFEKAVAKYQKYIPRELRDLKWFE